MRILLFVCLFAITINVGAQNTIPLPAGNTTIGGHLTVGAGNEVWTSANSLYFNYQGSAQTTHFWNSSGQNGKAIMSLLKNGFVGIGNENPKAPLEVNSTILINNRTIRGASFLQLQRSAEGLDNATISFGQNDNYLWHAGLLYNGGFSTPDFYISQSSVIHNSQGTLVRVPDFTITTEGKVGIGNDTPSSKLSINGGISVDGVNSIGSVNGFNNCIQLVNGGHAAIVYNPGQASELMFGMHSNGNFYWGTGQNASVGMKYVMTLSNNGLLANVSAVAIGCSNPGSYKLAVEGTIGAREVVVTATTPWPDYVFAPEYKLRTLDEIEQFVKDKQHLPDVPSAEAVAKDGVNLGEMNAILLTKVEELTLLLIEQNKRIQLLEAKVIR